MAAKLAKIYFSSRFARSLRKLPKKIQTQVHKKDQKFRQDPFDPSLKTHKLSGKLKDCWSYSVSRGIRILFKFVNGNKVLYIDIGSHKIYK